MRKTPEKPVKIDSKSVFEVNDSRLAIGVFNRPLLDAEARSFRRAWEMQAIPGLEDFQIDKKRVSFVGKPEAVPVAWEAVDRLLTRPAVAQDRRLRLRRKAS